MTPAAMAVPPSTASPASWNPAVPPPPVTGATVGNGVVNTGLGDGLGEGSGLGLFESDGLGEADGLALAEALGLDETLTDAEPVTAGVNTAGGVELDVQAESAMQATTVVRPQPRPASLTRCAVHAMAVRASIEPPHALGNHHFPVADRRNRRPKGIRRAGLWSRTGPTGELRGRKHRRS